MSNQTWRPIKEVSRPHNGLWLLWSIKGGKSWGYFNGNTNNWWDWTEDYMDFQPSHYFPEPEAPFIGKDDV